MTKHLSFVLAAAMFTSPALAHGNAQIHTHPEEMLGLAVLVALTVVGGYLAWKNRA